MTAGPPNLAKQFLLLSAGTLGSIAGNLLLVPATYRHLGPEVFGVWATLTAVQAVLLVLDLGNAVVQHLSGPLSTGDTRQIQRGVGASLVFLALIGVLLLASFCVSTVFLDWAVVWNAPSGHEGEARVATAIVFAGVAIGLPLSLVEKLNIARQQAGQNGKLALAASATTIVAVLVAVAVDGDLTAVTLASVTPTLLVRLAALFVLLKRNPMLRPAASDLTQVRALARPAAGFGVMQLAAVASYNSDQVVIARIVGPDGVAAYAVPAKVFGALVALTSAATSPLWPALMEAARRRRHTWIRQTVRRVTVAALLGGCSAGLLLNLAGPLLLEQWVGGGYEADPSLLIAFGWWSAVYCASSVITYVLIALEGVRRLMLLAVVNAMANVALSIGLTIRWGTAGAVWGSVISYVVVVVVPLSLWTRQALSKIGGGQSA